MTDIYHILRPLMKSLEFTLATYESLAGRKRQPAGELIRHENFLKEVFDDRKTMEAVQAVFARNAGPETEFTRLAEIFQDAKDKGQTPFEAVHGFFLTHRWNR